MTYTMIGTMNLIAACATAFNAAMHYSDFGAMSGLFGGALAFVGLAMVNFQRAETQRP